MSKTTKKVTISLTPDTHERIKQYAFENHLSVSAALTQLIWAAKVKNVQVRGQYSLKEVAGGVRRKSQE